MAQICLEQANVPWHYKKDASKSCVCRLGKSTRILKEARERKVCGAEEALKQVFFEGLCLMLQPLIIWSWYSGTVMESYGGYLIMPFIARKIEAGKAVMQTVRELKICSAEVSITRYM